MKNKILALFLAMTMVATMAMGMGSVAQAAGNYSITINANNQNTVKHEFSAYQIFKGSLDAKTNTLGDIQWGANVNVTDEKKLTFDGVEYGANDAAKLAEALSNKTDARDFATVVEAFITGDPVKSVSETEAGKGCVISGLEDGYYFIKDVTDLANANDTNSKFMVSIAGNDVSVNQKNETVSIIKEVMDVNDSDAADPTNNKYDEFADWDLGDKVPYQYTVVIPSDIDSYKNAYVFTFVDTMSAGLTFNNDVVVKVDGTVLTADEYIVITEGEALDANATFAIKTADMRNKSFAGKTMTVTYSATINEDAVVAGEGNKNDVRLRFSNNPNGEGEGETPTDTTVVFTFKLDVSKVDGNNKPLAGAGFTLYKKLADQDATAKTLRNDAVVFVYLDKNYNEVAKTAEGAAKFVKVGTVDATKNGENYTGSFKGIDDGEYVLVETKTPAGYNTAAPIEFTIKADHSTENPFALTVTGVSQTATGAETTVVNNAGSILPSTGGIGTTIFYVIGGILIVGGGVMLFVRNKATKEEK